MFQAAWLTFRRRTGQDLMSWFHKTLIVFVSAAVTHACLSQMSAVNNTPKRQSSNNEMHILIAEHSGRGAALGFWDGHTNRLTQLFTLSLPFQQ